MLRGQRAGDGRTSWLQKVVKAVDLGLSLSRVVSNTMQRLMLE